MKQYHKIYSPFKRDKITNKLVENDWYKEGFEYLKDLTWYATEKIDGTNIRIMWDGKNLTIGGKTDNAQLHGDLVTNIQNQFFNITQRQKFEEKFGEKQVCLYGEGYGAGIQKGGLYRQEKGFILFDVMIDGKWLNQGNVSALADVFECDLVKTVKEGTLKELIDYMKTKPNSTFGDFPMEGIVARPAVFLSDEYGERLITKIKLKDFKD